MKFGQIIMCYMTNISNFSFNSGDSMLSPNLFMILLKRQYNEIWSFLIVDINHFQFDLVHLFKKTKQESWHNCLLSILSRLLNRKEPLTQPQSSKLFKRFLKIIALAYIYQLSQFGHFVSSSSKIFKTAPCLMY